MFVQKLGGTVVDVTKLVAPWHFTGSSGARFRPPDLWIRRGPCRYIKTLAYQILQENKTNGALHTWKFLDNISGSCLVTLWWFCNLICNTLVAVKFPASPSQDISRLSWCVFDLLVLGSLRCSCSSPQHQLAEQTPISSFFYGLFVWSARFRMNPTR